MNDSRMMRRRRIKNIIQILLAVVLLYGFSYYFFRSKIRPIEKRRAEARPFSLYKCPYSLAQGIAPKPSYSYNDAPTGNAESRVLLIARQDSTYSKTLSNFIRYLKVPVRTEVVDGAELLLKLIKGRFSAIVFESFHSYAALNASSHSILHDYCRENSVGVLLFLQSREDGSAFAKFSNIEPVFEGLISEISFSSSSRIPFIAKQGAKLPLGAPDDEDWTFFPRSKLSSGWQSIVDSEDIEGVSGSVVLHGEKAGVEYIVFGQDLRHFFMKIAFWDALRYMVRDRSITLDSYIEIDIDDIFVGQSGTRLLPADINALLASQEFLRSHIEDFNYTLGFSGHFFRRGDNIENAADELLMAKADKFLWFPHMWHHNHAHEYESTYLEALMVQNEIFAKNYNLRTILSYAVSPQHSGVYPIHEALYEAWRSVWNITVTSTEEYPHLRPAWNRRAFTHNNISVLPRQTCGLFTHTHFFHAYPDGLDQLKKSIFGGDLFSTILLNPFLIFMTHQQNYGNDRLAHFTFHNEVLFLKCWTNLRLKWVTPERMAMLYFERFPKERNLVYTNPCTDNRHRKMLSVNVTCDGFQLPNLVIVGPQKTGTSALLSFLTMHPNVTTNENIEGSFEEMQFFGGYNYVKGLDWYRSKFRPNSSHAVVVEKTANYFDNPATPDLLHALLPEAKIAVMLVDPADRAYSWYQHMRSHGDSIATNMTAEELFSLLPEHPLFNATNRLRQRCLKPGHFAEHLDRWLDFFAPSQLLLIDAAEFRLNPVPILEDLAEVLELPTANFDYATKLRYVPEKGFFCAVSDGKSKCLGASKGRKYVPMSDGLRSQLNSYFAPYNRALLKLLRRYKFPIPSWLLL